MKRTMQFWPIVLTLLLLGLGIFLPRLTALAVDRKLEKDIVQRENTNLALTLTQESDFFQTLNLFRSGHSQVELAEGYRMTTDEVETTAKEVRKMLTNLEREDTAPEVTPMLLTSRDADLSGIFWRCVWADSADQREVLWLDDQSGLMISFEGRCGVLTLYNPETIFPESALFVAQYCRLYYPVDSVDLDLYDERFIVVEQTPDAEDPPIESDKLLITEAGQEDQAFTLTLKKKQNGQEKTFLLSIRWRNGWLYVNV